MKNNITRTMAVLCIIFVVFTIVAFIIPISKNGVFWISYLFGVISITAQGYTIKIAFNNQESVKSKFYGFPIAKIGFIYMCFQIIASFIFIVFSKFVPIWLEIIVCIVAFGIASIGFIAADAMREEINNQDSILKKDIYNMRTMQSKVRMMIGQCENSELSKKINILSEALQYSDPVSSDAIKDIESELLEYINELQKSIIDQEFSVGEVICKKTMDLLSERNRLCKLNK